MKPISADIETHLMDKDHVIPPPVCLGVVLDEDPENQYLSNKRTDDDWKEYVGLVTDPPPGYYSLWHNASFDLTVLCFDDPSLFPQVFKAYREGRIRCTKVQEKLLNLTRTGDLEYAEMPDGSKIKIDNKLTTLETLYLGMDRKDDKTGADSYRLRYWTLADVPLDQWPFEAIDYVVQDCLSLVKINETQHALNDQLLEERGLNAWGCNGDMAVLTHRCLLDFCLRIMTSYGIRVDKEEVSRVEAFLAEELSPDSIDLLVKNNIIVPAQPPRPYKNGAKNPDGTPKMKAATKEKLNKKVLGQYVESLAKNDPSKFEVRTTPKGQIQVDKEWLNDFAFLDPVLEQYAHRQSLQKLVTTELPRMKWQGEASDRVHPEFDFLKETGRTSSYAGKLYPSFNCQNVHAKIRNCFIPSEGHVLFSSDYEGMELGTVGQMCYQMYGFSRHRDLINEGVNIHTYLGAQLAYYLDEDFRAVCDQINVSDPMALYEVFKECADDPDTKAFFKKFRTFAKPTDLGYPGGLREKTFIQYAKATYGVNLIEMTGSFDAALDLAQQLRMVWLETFPEMEKYFDDLEAGAFYDPHNPDKIIKDKKTGELKTVEAFCYTTPMGMHRAKCTYCACANGMILQSPSAEGATMALVDWIQAIHDPTLQSPLYLKVRPLAFIHDEFLYEVEEGEDYDMISRETEKIMVDAMMRITPDVQSRVDTAIMSRWNKAAERVEDEHGRLQVWEPEE